METLEERGFLQTAEQYPPGTAEDARSFTELSSAFLGALVKTIKNTALYTLSHPLVLESLRKDLELLRLILRSGNSAEVTLTFVNGEWLFNGTPSAAPSQEALSLNAFLKAHGISELTFAAGAEPFELGALCELLAAPRGKAGAGARESLEAQGVTKIRPDSAHYVKEPAYAAAQFPPDAAPAQAQREQPHPIFNTKERTAPFPAQRPVPAQAKPAPAVQPPPRPAPEPARQTAPAPAQQPKREVYHLPPPSAGKRTGIPALDSIFGTHTAPVPEKAAPPAPPAAKPAEPGQQAGTLGSMSFGGILKGLVESAVKDPKDRVRAYEDAMKILKQTMEQQVAESTKALAEEKEHVVQTQSRTENVLSRVADGKVIVDKDGKILMMNPAAEEIAGIKLAEAVGKHISEHLRPGEHFLTLSKDMDLSKGKLISGEVEVKGDEAMGRALRRSVALLVDGEDRVVGAFSTLPEITKYKDAQRMQEEFLSRITHDLQSPLSSITSALEMLNDSAAKLDPVENNFLDISIRNSRRLSNMIKGILDFSKLQAGKLDMHPVPSQVAPILAEAEEGLVPLAASKGVKLSIRPAAPELWALADPPRIVQVLTNLISNAIKATPKGGSVTVAAAPDPQTPDAIVFGVRDTGHGIPKEDLEKVFEKFVQLSSYETQEGVGLGLAIVNDFVKMHKGRIWADSEVGKGTTFYFTLPRAEEPVM